MKRILSLLTLALLLGGPAAAQDWGELLKQTLTNAADKATDGKLTQYALPGTWSYSSPGVRFEGDDAAADLGAQLLSAALSDQLGKIYAKAGLTPGTGSITFDREGGFSASLGEQKIEGKYPTTPERTLSRSAPTTKSSSNTDPYRGVPTSTDRPCSC